MAEDYSYKGNNNLKPLGYQHEFTLDQIREVAKCKADPIYFIENFCQVVTLDDGLVPFKLYEPQKEFIDLIHNNRKVVVMQPRQTGKTQVAAAYIVWYSIFEESKTVGILANKGTAAREVMFRYQNMYESLPIWLQQGVKTWNKGDVELENGSRVFTASTTISGPRGKSINFLYVDETAIIPNNIAEQFFASTYPTISAGKTTKILLTSTPLGFNHFWKFWNEASKTEIPNTPGKNGFIAKRVYYWDIPGRDEAWAEEQLATLQETKFNQEVLCEFLGSSLTLINGRTLGNMSSIDPVRTSMDLDVFVEPEPNKTYVLVVDTAEGVGGDYSAFTIMDVTQVPYVLVAKYRNNKIAPMLYPTVIHKVAKEYNMAYVLVETNSIGRQIVDILYTELEYENIVTTIKEGNKTHVSPGFAKATTFGVRTDKVVKRQGCFALKSLLEEGKMNIFDADIISELSTFTEKNGSFSADEGYHDDLVMTLVLFAWLTTNQYFTELTDINIREKIYKEQMSQIEDELTPFGLIENGLEEEFTVESGDLWKLV